MEIPIDLRRFEKLYDSFDKGHNRKHLESVRSLAVSLAKKYAPSETKLAYIAATLHDIGIAKGRENHEISGAEMVLADRELQKKLLPNELEAIAQAVREHRATTGQPKTTLAKIISDADRGADTTASALRRAYDWGKKNLPELDEDDQIIRAGKHLLKKYGPGGVGRRSYFPETTERLERVYAPIIEAAKKEDLDTLRVLMKGN